jgi:hypothetical protein
LSSSSAGAHVQIRRVTGKRSAYNATPLPRPDPYTFPSPTHSAVRPSSLPQVIAHTSRRRAVSSPPSCPNRRCSGCRTALLRRRIVDRAGKRRRRRRDAGQWRGIYFCSCADNMVGEGRGTVGLDTREWENTRRAVGPSCGWRRPAGEGPGPGSRNGSCQVCESASCRE